MWQLMVFSNVSEKDQKKLKLKRVFLAVTANGRCAQCSPLSLLTCLLPLARETAVKVSLHQDGITQTLPPFQKSIQSRVQELSSAWLSLGGRGVVMYTNMGVKKSSQIL